LLYSPWHYQIKSNFILIKKMRYLIYPERLLQNLHLLTRKVKDWRISHHLRQMKSQFCNKKREDNFCGRHNKKFKKILFFVLPISFCLTNKRKRRKTRSRRKRLYPSSTALLLFFFRLQFPWVAQTLCMETKVIQRIKAGKKKRWNKGE